LERKTYQPGGRSGEASLTDMPLKEASSFRRALGEERVRDPRFQTQEKLGKAGRYGGQPPIVVPIRFSLWIAAASESCVWHPARKSK